MKKGADYIGNDYFRAGESSWKEGTSIKIHLQHDKERHRREKLSVYLA